MLEVIAAIGADLGATEAELDNLRRRKRDERGGSQRGIPCDCAREPMADKPLTSQTILLASSPHSAAGVNEHCSSIPVQEEGWARLHARQGAVGGFCFERSANGEARTDEAAS